MANKKMINKNAAPPITIPAIAPPERTGEEEASGAEAGSAQTMSIPREVAVCFLTGLQTLDELA